jgi:hypothetical protein
MSVNDSKRGNRTNARKAARSFERFARTFKITLGDRVARLSAGSSLRRGMLLGGTALATSLFVYAPGEAWAACAVGVNSVSCGSTTTTDTTSPVNAPNDRHYSFTAATVTGDTQAPALVQVFGLAVTNTQAGGTLAFTNSGQVAQNTVPSGANGGTAALNLSANGGLISYTGSGAVTSIVNTVGLNIANVGTGGIDFGAGSVATVAGATFVGSSGVVLTTGTGPVSIGLNGGSVTATGAAGDGLSATTGGSIAATITGTTISASNGAGSTGAGVTLTSTGGSINLTSSASIGSATGTNFTTGISSTGNAAATNTVTTTGGSIFVGAGGIGISATTGTTVTVNNAGTIDAQTGVAAGTGINATNTAAISVTNTGAISGTAALGTFATGINAVNTGAAGGVTVGTSGAGSIGAGVAVTGTGINAVINNAANAEAVSVTANAGVAAASPGSVGINATSNGGGAATSTVTVGGTGPVSATQNGIQATHTGAGPGAGVNAVTVTGTGSTSGAVGFGILAQINNSANAGNVLVDRNGTITAVTTGIFANTNGGLAATPNSGNVTVNYSPTAPGTALTAGGTGINALQTSVTASNTGSVSVTVGANAVLSTGGGGGGANGVNAQITGVASSTGTVTVSNAGAIDQSVGAGAANIGVNATTIGLGAVSVTNSGAISGIAGRPAFVTGINADITNTGSAANVTVDGGGTIGQGTAVSGVGINATTVGTGSVLVGSTTAVGSIRAGTNAINAVQNGATPGNAGGVSVTIAAAAQLESGAGGGNDTAINAQITGVGTNTGTVVVNNAGGVDHAAGAAAGGTGINATTIGLGAVSVANSGTISGINGRAGFATGINAQITNAASSATVTVTGNGRVGGDGSVAFPGARTTGAGIDAITVGTGNVVVGTTTPGQEVGSIFSTGTGIQAVQNGGGATSGSVSVVTLAGATINVASNVADGIFAPKTGTGAGTVAVDNRAAVDKAAGFSGGTAINARSNGGSVAGISVSVANTGAISGTAGLGSFGTGINATTVGQGSVVVSTSGAGSIGAGVAPIGSGIFAAIGTAGGTNLDGVFVTADANVTAGTNGIVATTNGNAGGLGTTSVVTVTGAGAVTGDATVGINATHSGTGPAAGTNAVTVSGTGTTASAAGAGINAQITNAANAGNVLVNRSGAVTAGTTGINAETAGTGSVVVVSGAGQVTAGTAPGNTTADGIVAQNTLAGNTSTVSVTANGNVSAPRNAILALHNGVGTAGANSVAVATAGGTTVTGGANGIVAATTIGGNVGNVVVTADGAVNGNGVNAAGPAPLVAALAASLPPGSPTTGYGVVALDTGSGTVTVAGAGTVNGLNGGIAALQVGGGSGAGTTGVLVSGSGATTSTNGFGLAAAITQAANASNIIVNRSGTVTGATGGIIASTAGVGAVTVQGTGTVTTTAGTGIAASSAGGNVTIGGAGPLAIGPVSGASGITAATTGAGTVSVTASNNVTGTAGNGIATSVGAGSTATLTINPGATVQAPAGFAAVTGNNLTVAQNGTVTNTGGNGVGANAFAFTSGTNAITFGNASANVTGDVNVAGAATLNFAQGNGVDTTLSAPITGAGTVTKTGGNRITLTGANTAASNFTGTANVNGGALRVNGTFGDVDGAVTAVLNVNAGGTVDGIGTIAANVNVNNGGTFAAGNSPGTINIVGSHTVNAGSNNIFELGQSGVVNGPNNDLVNITGNLTINGGTLTLLAADSSNTLVSGLYGLYRFTGAGTFNAANVAAGRGGFDTVTSAPGSTAQIFTPANGTAPAGQVNALLNNGAQIVQFWDGADLTGNGTVDGGTGTFSPTNTNWTTQPGSQINTQFQGGVGIFAAAPGTVTVTGANNFQGFQFVTDGYVVNGPGTLNMTGDPFTTADRSFFNVDAGVTATVNAGITGNAGIGLRKIGTGTLVVGGSATYPGVTTVDAGTLVVAGTGSIVGTSAVTNNAMLMINAGGTVTTAGTVANNAGATFTTAGTLNGGSVTNAAAGTFNLAGGTVTTPTFTNNGTLNSTGGAIAAPTFTNTSVVNGILQLANSTTATNTASGTINNGIAVAAAPGGSTFANAGTAGTGGLVFANIGGALTANNMGTFSGFVNGAAGTTTTVNNSGTWNYTGTSTLSGAETFNNTGTFRVAAAGTLNGLETFNNNAGSRFELAADLGGSIATFNNNATNPGSANLGSQGNGTGQGVFTGAGVFLQDRSVTGITTFNNNGFLGAVSTAGGANNTIGAATFNNQSNGVISLVNSRPTDTLTLTGNYNGSAGSVIALDVNLNQSTRQGDVVRINGQNNGQTTLVLNRLDNPVMTLFSSQAVPVVVSGGGAGQVTLAEPIQGSGFATFELEQNAAGSFQIVSRLNTSAASGAANSISALITSLNVGFFQSVSAFIGAPNPGQNPDECTGPAARNNPNCSTVTSSVSSDPKMSWAKLNATAAAQKEVAAAPGIIPNTISSGMWARGSGGNFTVRGNSTSTFAGGATVGQAFKVENSFAGMQVGIDTGVFNIDNTGWNLHLGITGGSVFADGTQKIGAQTTGVFDVPFIGVYGALTNGPFFSDLNYRHDFFNARISNQLAGLSGTRLQIESNSVSGSSGYRFDFEGLFGTELPYFIEPSGSMSYTKTSIGSLPVIGGTLQFRDIDSILGRFGLRFGTAFQATENLAVQPFVTGSVWHEFAGNTVSRFVSANIAADPNAFVPIVTDRVGTFGQVGVGISAQVLDTPLLGYVRSDFRFGDKLEGYAVNGGIRYQF